MARTDKAALNEGVQLFLDTANARLGIEEIWLQNYRQYRGISQTLLRARQENRSGVFIPKTFEKVETVAPRLVRSLLADRPWVKVLPRPPFNDFSRAAMMEHLLDFQLAEKSPFLKTTTNVIRNALIYGIGPAQIGWKRKVIKRKRRPLRITRDADGREVAQLGDKIPEEVVLYNGPWVVDLDPFGFYWDPYATSLEDAEYVIVQTFRSARWLKTQAELGIYKNINKALQTSMPENLPSWLEERRQITGWADNWRKVLYEHLEIWTPDRVTTIINRQVVVRNEDSPFDHGELPFAVATDTQLPQEFAGLGLVLPMSDLQDEINAKRNQRLDNVNLILNKVFMVRRGSNIDEDSLKIKSGGIIPVDDFDEIKEFEFDDVTSSAYLEEERIDRDIQATTGVFDYAAGATPQRRETATGIISLQSASDERFRLKVWQLARDFLIPVYRQAAYLNQQFLQAEDYIQILGPGGLPFAVSITPEQIAGDFEFRFDGSTIDTVADRQFKLNQMIQLFGLASQVEGVNREEYIRRILQLAEVPDIDSIVPTASGVDANSLLAQLLGLAGATPTATNATPSPAPAPSPLPVQSIPGIGATTRMGPTPQESRSMI